MTLDITRIYRIHFVYFILPCFLMLLTGCSSWGWQSKDSKTQTGTFFNPDGTKYVGGFSENLASGKGTLFYVYPEYQERKNMGFQMHDDAPSELDGSILSGEFSVSKTKIMDMQIESSDIKDNTQVKYVSATNRREPFTYVGNYAHGGFEGKGVVTFKDGRRFEGRFSNEEMLYSKIDKHGRAWDTNRLIGSKFSGYGVMSWPKTANFVGAEFEGVAYDYNLFIRKGSEHSCVSPIFLGKGILHVNGKDIYDAFVMEEYDHSRVWLVSKKQFDEKLSYYESQNCDANLTGQMNQDNSYEARRIAEINQARQSANAWLSNEIANMPSRMKSDMANLDAASRGTSVAAEEAKALRNADFYVRIAAMEADPNSDLNKDKRANERAKMKRHADELQRKADYAKKKEELRKTAAADDERHATQVRERDAASEKSRRQHEANELKEKNDQEKKRMNAEHRAEEIRIAAEHTRNINLELAKKKAAKEQQERDEQDRQESYLNAMRSGIRLSATTCPDGVGHHYVNGTRPKIKGNYCIDVYYQASCAGSRTTSTGVATNFIGLDDCFGDTYQINPKPACQAELVRVVVTDVRFGCK